MSKSKVFIIYPHNPQPYVYTPPTAAEELRRRHPEKNDIEISEMRVQEAESRANDEKKRINNHNELVDRFAKFLKKSGVDVAYEGLLQDKSTANYMRWFQEKLNLSDFIILIITESFNYFLSDHRTFPRDGQEQIFEGEFLHTLVHQSSKPLLPVFLGPPKNLDLLPDVLRCSSTYHIKDIRDFSVHQSEMDSLYAVLTKQNRFDLPSQGSIVELPKPIRFGPRLQQHPANPLMASQPHQRMYTSLRDCPTPLTSINAATLSEKTGFAKHWKRLTQPLYLSNAEVERIEADEPQETERCFQVLCHWMKTQGNAATVAKLAEVVSMQCQDLAMLEILYTVCRN